MTRDQVIQWARESGLIGPNDWLINGNKIEAFAALVAAYEREECAGKIEVAVRENVKELEDKISAMALEALSAEGQWMEHTATQQATIAEMQEAIGSWDRAESDEEIQAAEAKLISCLRTYNLDELHEALAKECERLKLFCEEGFSEFLPNTGGRYALSCMAYILWKEAAAHRARKERA